MYIIAGLGNPTREYDKTRHNAGFSVIDVLADRHNIDVSEKKHKALCGKGMIEGEKVILVKPQTYMNLSGESIREVMDYYKLDPSEELIVIYDDISLNPGQLRIRLKGSHGGQNGMRSIIKQCGTDTFPRIKMGIGAKPNPGWDLADGVLSKFSTQELKPLEQAIENAYQAAALMVQNKVNEAMNQYNS